MQHEDFWDTLAGYPHIHRREISSMNEKGLILDDGSEIAADAILCGTGWKPIYPFFCRAQCHALGLPHPFKEDSAEEAETWNCLLEAADRRITSEFPLLSHPPVHQKPDFSLTTSRLYNCIAPLTDSSIAFFGHAHLSNSFRTAEAQAIWTTAYFDGSICLPPLEQAQKEVAYMNAFSRRRYPSHGARGDYLFLELVWYSDRLMEQVGLRSHRGRGRWWWDDWLEPCLASDYRNMVAEYKKKFSF